MTIALAEGFLDKQVMSTLVERFAPLLLPLQIRDARGGANFWVQAVRYNEAARRQRVLGLVDLENAECPSALIASHLARGKNEHFYLRIASRMVESWLLSDRVGISRFLAVRQSLIPHLPDHDPHPKRTIVQLARSSKNRMIRSALVPIDSGALVGPEYVIVMQEFLEKKWDPVAAAECSPSLRRCIDAWTSAAA